MTTPDFSASVVAVALPGSRLAPPSEPLGEDDWARLLRRVVEQRIPGFLLHGIEEGRFPATTEQWEQAADRHLESMRGVLVLERLLLEVVAAFERDDIDYRVLKGSAYAHLDYPDPAVRSFGDIDIVVPTSRYDDAVDALATVGARRRVAEIRPGFDRRFGKGGSFVTATGLEIDLHRMFVSGPLGLSMRLDDLFTASDSFVVGGQELRALTRELRFLHACFHATLGSLSPTPRLLAVRDVAQMLLHPALDSERVQALCTAWQAEAVVARAIRWAWDTLELADILPLTVWAYRYAPDRQALAQLSVYGPGVPFATQAAAGVSAVRGVGAKAAYLRALALPGRPYRLRALRSLRRLLGRSRPSVAPGGGG